MSRRKTKICKQCSAEFYGQNKMFCSKRCIGKSLKGTFGSGLKKYQEKHFPARFAECKICGVHFKVNRKSKGIYCSKVCYNKSQVGRKVPSNSGANCHFWRGGVTPKNMAIRRSTEYRLWRESVFKRDDWTCQECGDRGGRGHKVIIHADHIKPFALYPELHFAIGNGRTLCAPCHRKTPTWGMNALYLQQSLGGTSPPLQ